MIQNWGIGISILLGIFIPVSLCIVWHRKQTKLKNNSGHCSRNQSRYDSLDKLQNGQFAAISAHLYALVQQIYAYGIQQDKQDKERASRETRTLAAAISAAVVGVITVGVLWMQLEDARTATAADQRPWIGPQPRALPTRIQLRDSILNAGKSPALNVRIATSYAAPNDLETQPAILNAPCLLRCKLLNIEMLPNIPFTIGLLFPPTTGIPESPLVDIPGRIIARVDYEDVQGKGHKTKVCFVHSIETHDVKGCSDPNSNYAD